MPIRDPAPGQLSETIYRSFRFGQIAELIMLETRLLARSKQLDYGADLKIVDGKPDYKAFAQALNDPGRQLLGGQQRQWLGETLKASVGDGVRWQVLGNQVLMARVPGPDLVRAFGPERIGQVLAVLPDDTRVRVQAMIGLFSNGNSMPFNLDAWDGYPAERERLYDLIKASGARVVVTSGDSHTAWANELHDASGRRVAVELGVTSVTSPTKFLDAWLPDLQLAKTLAEQAPEVIAADDSRNGYVRLTLTNDAISGEWMSIDTITSQTFSCTAQARFTAHAEAAGVSALTVSG
jgi:alkaline phosphatase D